jgi:hypothetical protein
LRIRFLRGQEPKQSMLSSPKSTSRASFPRFYTPSRLRSTSNMQQTRVCIRDQSYPHAGGQGIPITHTLERPPSRRANRRGPSVSGKHASGILPRRAFLCSALSPIRPSSSPQTRAAPSTPARPFFPMPPCCGRIMPPTHSIMAAHSLTPRPFDAEHSTGFTILRCSARNVHVGWQPLQPEHCHVLRIVVGISWGHTRCRWSDAHRAGGALHSALASIPAKFSLSGSILPPPPPLHYISSPSSPPNANALILSRRVFVFFCRLSLRIDEIHVSFFLTDSSRRQFARGAVERLSRTRPGTAPPSPLSTLSHPQDAYCSHEPVDVSSRATRPQGLNHEFWPRCALRGSSRGGLGRRRWPWGSSSRTL